MRKQDEKPEASVSKVKVGSMGMEVTESPKKKTKVEVVILPRVGPSMQVESEGGECGKELKESIAEIVGVANRLSALMRVVQETNELAIEAVEHLGTIADYFIHWLESDNDFGSKLDWTLGDKDMVHDVDL